MSSTLDRLRRLQGLRAQRQRAEPEIPPPSQETDPPRHGRVISPRLEEAAPGKVIENDAGLCYLSTHTLPIDHEHGGQPLGKLLDYAPSAFAPFFPKFDLHPDADFCRAAFIDTETTGLGGGAGVYCFMVGVGLFEFPAGRSPRFAVHQLFMRNPAEEPALLVALTELLADRELVVTFNGRSFDLPLLRTRYRQNRAFLPEGVEMPTLLEPGRAHLDLLMPARQLWRRRLQSCRLINLEQHILGLFRSQEDVPGHLIPLIYTQYVQSGNASQIANVFYHNQEDIVSMVGIAERQVTLFGRAPDHVEAAELDGLEWLALGLCYDNIEQWEHAEPAYRKALEQVRRPDDQREVFQRLAQLLKRQERWEAAIDLWQRWLSTVPGPDPTPYVELAKYCEWQLKDLEQAEMWAGWALHNLSTAPGSAARGSQVAELEHRVARLQRKQAGTEAS